MDKRFFGGVGCGIAFTLALSFFLIWAGCGWRFAEAERFAYGILCQGLNTLWWGAA